MSLQATPPVDASVDVSLRVPRGETGDLESGVAAVLGRIDGVAAVTVQQVTSVRPTFTDIRVSADATVRVAVPAETDPRTAVAERLADGFGITAVDDIAVDSR
ncbi:hypothetical protein [Haloarcula marina]|uniref:hypothetical protein n=1 Tax=Haloarcula marina TaxID=2961574 RepID=UPI0020B708EA|nr:hypothetical protein [Halomicroarcula marina]